MGNRGISRARIFLGAILLLAATMTWIIILMMNPHGPATIHGTQPVRSTIVTFKRNAAIGTLVLCALGGWLEFPRRRPKRPARDLGLAALIFLLAGSSLYTLIWNEPYASTGAKLDENYAIEGQSADGGNEPGLPAVSGGPPTALADMNVAPSALSFHPQNDTRATELQESQKGKDGARAIDNSVSQQPVAPTTMTTNNPEASGPSDEPSNDEVDDNQD